MSTIINLSRRDFLKTTGIGCAALLIGSTFAASPLQAGTDTPGADAFSPNYFIKIAPNGQITLTCGRSEMGQGVRTGIPMMIAEELDADWNRVTIWQAPGDKTKYDPQGKDGQNTDGSRSTRHAFDVMRELGAATRDILERAAAQKWSVPQSEVYAQNHRIHHRGTTKSLDYGALVDIAAGLSVPENPPTLKAPSQWNYIAKDLAMVDGADIHTGTAVYGADVVVPGMKVAVVARCPVYRGKVKRYDAAKALSIPGVEQVVEIPALPADQAPAFNALGGIAVIGTNTWSVITGREQLEIEWDLGPYADNDSAQYDSMLSAMVNSDNGTIIRNRGNAPAALQNNDMNVITAEYAVPFYTHMPMEPPVAMADATTRPVTIWAPSQNPNGAREAVAKALGINEEEVECNVTLLGGGFGRKSKADFICEAAILSDMIKAPVRVQWTREDDIQHGYYHGGSAQKLQAAIDTKTNTVSAWVHDVAGPTIFSLFSFDERAMSPVEQGLGLTDMLYNAVPNIQLTSHGAEAKLRIGWLRSVNNIQHAFALNSFAHELADAMQRDPLDVMLELIGNADELVLPSSKDAMQEYPNYGDPAADWPVMPKRLSNVLQVVADKSDYRQKRQAGNAVGIACHRSFHSYVAVAVHAEVDEKQHLRIPQVDIAIDCGRYINPDGVKKQMEGSVVFGHTLAMHGSISTADGAVEQNNFYDSPVSRIDDAPLNVHVHLIDDYIDHKPCGVGEPGVPPYAPALANAIYLATGKRHRTLPIKL